MATRSRISPKCCASPGRRQESEAALQEALRLQGQKGNLVAAANLGSHLSEPALESLTSPRYPRAVPVHHLSRADARRIAVHAQLLDAPRPTDLVAMVRQLTLLQIDPTAAIAPSADLVAWSRLGSSYRPADLRPATD